MNIKMNIKLKHLLMVTVFSIFSINHSVKAKEVSYYETKHFYKKVEFIKKSFKPGKIKTIKAKLIKKVLIGYWDLAPPEGVTFKEDGTFVVEDWSSNNYITYHGKWKTIDNAISFKVDGSKKWQVCKILYIIYRTCLPNCPKGIGNHYTFTIETENTYFKTEFMRAMFLEGGLSISFN